jgi:Arc/MetJ family transcription regulator
MRTTLDLPEDLVKEAMKVTKIKTKTGVIKTALTQLIQKERMQGIKRYYGKLDLEIDLNSVRERT